MLLRLSGGSEGYSSWYKLFLSLIFNLSSGFCGSVIRSRGQICLYFASKNDHIGKLFTVKPVHAFTSLTD